MTGAKKTHWLRNTLVILIVCALAGTILAAILFGKENIRIYASSSLQFSFSKAAEGKAPNGLPFDTQGLYSDEVLNAALESAGLSGKYTAEQIRKNLSIIGVYPEKIVEQMTGYVSLLENTGNSQAVMTDYHATQYSVKLYNDFDKNISRDQLDTLLGEILTAFRQNFAETYAAGLNNTNPFENLEEYDYGQQLEAITQSGEQLKRYAEEMQNLAPDFKLNRKGFGDIAALYSNLSNDLNRVDAVVMLNAISKDRDRLQQRYEMEIRTLKQKLASLKEELTLIDARMNAYEKEGIIYVSANGTLRSVGSNADETYDSLVKKRKEVSDTIADTSASISLYEIRLAAITGDDKKSTTENGEETDVVTLTDEEVAQLKERVETEIQAILTKKAGIDAEFKAMLDAYSAQEINEKTVSASAVKYYAPSLLSGAFLKQALKVAGPFCAVGFMVCLVLMIRSRRKEEKQNR